jgi:Tfp pilus assembly protein PilX
MKRQTSDERGTILLVFVITLPFLILLAIYYTQTSLVSFRTARQDQLRTAAQLSADAGADLGVLRISQDNAWAGTTGEVELSNDTRTKTTYEVSVASNAGNTKTMTVTGRSYSPVTSTTPAKRVKVFVDMRPISSGDFGIISGQGGLIMVNNSKVVGGDVFINGEVKLSNFPKNL